MVMKYLKRYPVENIKNVRDLGGVPTIYGNVTNWGKFIRSASLDDSKDCDIKYLIDLGITTVIDLRREGEIDKSLESHKKITDNFDYHNVSLAGDREFRQEEIDMIISRKLSVGASYRNLIDNYKGVREIMEIMAGAEGSILFHCQEGKDRTGMISMILMGISDVSKSDIIADYEISSAYLGYIERYEKSEDWSVFRITDPYNMREAYEYIIRKYGGFYEYLDYAKVDVKTIDKLRDMMIN